VLVHHLPPDAALHYLGLPEAARSWGVGEVLLSDLFLALTGKPHPARPSATTRSERYRNLRERLEAQRARTS
jgi:hypothetical protein